MDENNEQGKELYCFSGVILKNQASSIDDDSNANGSLSIVEYSYGKCIEWKPEDVSEVCDGQEQDWSIVNKIDVKNFVPLSKTYNGPNDMPSGSKTARRRHAHKHVHRIRHFNGPQHHRSSRKGKKHYEGLNGFDNDGPDRSRPIRIELRDLKSFKIKHNRSLLDLMLKDGTTYSSFYFQIGNAECFVKPMRSFLKTRKSHREKNLYIVVEEKKETQSLNNSFAELNLYPENPSETVGKFFSNLKKRPYVTVMETFSKLNDLNYFTNYQPESRPNQEVAELLNRSLSTPGSEAEPEDEYQMVPHLPPRPNVTRGPPLTVELWSAAFDDMGRVEFPEKIEQVVFRGGITPALRCTVWKYLLGYYPWHASTTEITDIRKQKADEYFRMKLQWRSMSPAQEEKFSDYRDRKSLIEKDVNRTDRTHPFFEGDNNTNLALLSDILMTYVMYNFDLGYVQGMSDLLSPILILMSNEVDAFWCFVGLMNRVFTNFDMDQAGMKLQLSQLQSLLAAAEPELALHLDQHESSNMFFCFRWLLIIFKREFTNSDIMVLWEVLFTNLPCPNFHLLLCVAILDGEKNILIENKYGFTEILKHVNDLSLSIDVNHIICKAESIYLQLAAITDLPLSVKRIIGLAPPGRTGDSSEDEEEETSPNNTPECEQVNFVSDPEEVEFEKSINMTYH